MIAWAPHVLSLELRKIFSYRFAFWIRYLVGAITELAVAYFLWDAIFSASASPAGELTRIGGFTFHGILFYYVFAALGAKIIQNTDPGGISKEVYEGTLTRYLLYPISFLGYRYVSHFGQQLIAIAQLLLGFFVANMIWAQPSDSMISVQSITLGIGTALLSGVLMFLLNASLELVAFWQDTVWNLMAMLRFIGNLLGGLLVPLSLFPEWGRDLARFTPFPLIFSFPIRCFLGQVGPAEWFRSALELSAWIVGAALLVAWIWRRGTRVYSGVGV